MSVAYGKGVDTREEQGQHTLLNERHFTKPEGRKMSNKVQDWLANMRAWSATELQDMGGADLEVSTDGQTWVPITSAHFQVKKSFQVAGQASDPNNGTPQPAAPGATA